VTKGSQYDAERELPRVARTAAAQAGPLAAEFNETAELKTSFPRKDRLGVGIALVCRPWIFSATAAMRRS